MSDRVPLIPRRVLFDWPERTAVAISPDGARLAYLAPHGDVMNVWVQPVGDESAARPVTATAHPVREYLWGRDSRHVVYLVDEGGHERCHVHVVDVDGKVGEPDVDVTPFPGVSAMVVAVDDDVPDAVLVAVNHRTPELHDLHRVDVTRGRSDLVAENPGFSGMWSTWLVARGLRPRGGVRPCDDGSFAVEVGESDDIGTWRTAMRIEPDDVLGTNVLGFTPDGDGLYVISTAHGDTSALVRRSLTTGEESVLFVHDRFDIESVLFHPATREPDVVTVVGDRVELHPLTADAAALVALVADDPSVDVRIESRSASDDRWIVACLRPDAPTTYALVDRPTATVTPLFEDRPALRGYELAPMQAHRFGARDGWEIPVYVTFPPGAPRRGLPTIVRVHGGPWARDRWEWSPYVQWMANRGYLVVQVQFRGSAGYGKRFMLGGRREWGGRMQDDLVDAVHWVVGQGWADPDRVCIYGGSYGGYAALVGAAFTPELFRCAVDVFGPTDLVTFLEAIPPYWRPAVRMWHDVLGDPVRDADDLLARSPLSRADDIDIPLLVAHGSNDTRVAQSESDRLVEALRRRGVPHEYLVFADEGHGITRPANMQRFHEVAEAFLARHLGGRCEPAPTTTPG